MDGACFVYIFHLGTVTSDKWFPCAESGGEVPVLEFQGGWSHPFAAITPRSTLILIGSICTCTIYWVKKRPCDNV